MSSVQKGSPDDWAARPGGSDKTAAKNRREQNYRTNLVISLTEPAIRLLKSEALLQEFLNGLSPDHFFLKAKSDLTRFTAIIGDCITIAILSAELAVTHRAQLGQRIRSLIREMTRNFNRLCFDLQKRVGQSEGPVK